MRSPNREGFRICPGSGAHGFVCFAVNRNTSNAVITIQPTGYGKMPVKKANRVAISKTINNAEIQSKLILSSPAVKSSDSISVSWIPSSYLDLIRCAGSVIRPEPQGNKGARGNCPGRRLRANLACPTAQETPDGRKPRPRIRTVPAGDGPGLRRRRVCRAPRAHPRAHGTRWA